MSVKVQSQDKNDPEHTFSERLSSAMALRKESKLSLARKIGSSHTSVARWLEGKAIGTAWAIKIASQLNVDVQWLLTGDGSMEPNMDRLVDAQLSVAPSEMARTYLDSEIIAAIDEWWGMYKDEEKSWMRVAVAENLLTFTQELYRREAQRHRQRIHGISSEDE